MAGEGATTTNINKLLEEGKTLYDQKDYETSTAKLGEACQQLDQLNGELDPKNGDAYFLYGRSLLEYAIQRNSVLGQSAQATAEEVETQQVEATVSSAENTNPRFQFDEQPVFEETNKVDHNEDNNDNNEDDDSGDEESDDFETAWDVLDVARVIFEKGQDDESKIKLADVLLCLCDVSLETEKFNEALPDFKKAIEIKRSLLKPDDRQLAEAHYKYALALELSNEPAQLALDQLQKAQTVLKEKVATLNKGIEKDDTNSKGKGKCTVNEDCQREIKEIQELVVELDEKITELSTRTENENEAQELLKNLFGGLSKTGDGTPALDLPAAAQINDLSNLIKRKAKEVVDNNNSTSNSSDVKKPKIE
ncbi:hypothetical protein BC941DRAFT_491799 [Chlamydoabsidia padenii]|nr:hypothetical protein BC941DRAFT_491799 [Chlamydoabsidia padenii]